MTDSHSNAARWIPAPRARVTAEHLLVQLLGTVAGAVLGPGAAAADVADLLGGLFGAMRLHDDLSQGKYPPRGAVPPRSQAMADFETVVAAAVRHHRGCATAAGPATALPARLQVSAGAFGPGFQPGASSAPDEITRREAAAQLGLSRERVRELIGSGELTGWQEDAGRHEWHITRASVIAYRKRKDGGDGPGGAARRSA